MNVSARNTSPIAAALCLLLTLPLIAGLLVQEPSPSPSPTPTASPTQSPSPQRTPSPTPLPGAQNFHQWGSVTVFNGLPSDSVRAIAQTPNGVMWFGTDNGLARFDGRRIQNFSPGGPGTNAVLALRTSPSGELLIGTRAGAFVHSENRFIPIAGTENVGITTIRTGATTYLGTDDGNLLRLIQGDQGSVSAEQVLPQALTQPDNVPAAITGIVERNGEVLFATYGLGVFSLDGGKGTPVNTPPTSTMINAIGATDQLWLGTDALRDASGIYRSMGSRFERITAPTSKVLTIEINDGGVWAGTERFGLFHIADGKLKKNYTFENTSGGLRSNNILTQFTDREGVLWIGTNRGVSRFDRSGAVQETVSDIPNSNFVRVLYRTRGGNLYAGSNRGLFVHNSEKWNPVPEYGNRPVFALAEDGSGRLLVGTTARAPANDSAENTIGQVRAFAIFRGEIFEAVFGTGLIRKKAAGDTLVHAAGSLTALLGTNEKLWIGTVDQGVLSFDGSSVKPEFRGTEIGTIRKIFQAADRAIWIAGEKGVFVLRGDKPERVINASDVRDVYVSGTDVWAATTTRGLLHSRFDDRFGWITSSIAFEQGLPSEKAFSIVPDDDNLLIGTNRGVVSYGASPIAPKIIVTRVLSQRVHDLAELRSTIALEYPQNSILIEVAGQSSRTYPEEFQYAFVLKNEKGEEVDRRLSNDPQYAPADLSPGNFTIEAIAFNRDLLASDPMAVSFSIAKAPFPWTATALGALLAMSLIALVWAVVERRRITQRNRELAAARLDLANEAERERRRIARDLHDQTLADLRNLMMTTDKNLQAGAEIRREIESISTDIRRICEDLSPSVLENVGLVAALEFLASHSVENYTFKAADNLEERIDLPLNVQLQIYRITQEVLANIARHSNATEVEMAVESTATEGFHISIRDNGRSFQPDGAPQRGRGISNIRARANLINGRVAWKESRKGGNVFSLKVDPSAR